MIVLMRDVRAARMCSRGARVFLEKHGVDWAAFLRSGVDSELLIATGDAMALRVVEEAHGRLKQKADSRV